MFKVLVLVFGSGTASQEIFELGFRALGFRVLGFREEWAHGRRRTIAGNGTWIRTFQPSEV